MGMRQKHPLPPGGASGKEPACQCRRRTGCGFHPWVGKIPWRRAWQPTPVFLPGGSNGQGSLEGFSPKVAQSQTWLKRLSSSRGNRLLDDGHSAWCEVVSQCSFDFYFYCGFLPNQRWQDSAWGLKVLLHLDCQVDLQGTFQKKQKMGNSNKYVGL